MTPALAVLLTTPAHARGDDGPTFAVDAAVRIEGGRIDDGGVVATVGPAVVVPVVQGGQTVGVGFVGEGTFALTFPDPADALRFANRQVVYGKADPDTLRGVAHRDTPFTTAISQGFVFGSSEVLASWLEGEPTAGADAASALSSRLAVLDDALDLTLGQRRRVGQDQWVVADFLGETRLRYVRPLGVGSVDDRYLTLYRNDVQGWPAADVMAIGQTTGEHTIERTVALGLWEEPPRGDPETRRNHGLESVRADAKVFAQPLAGGNQVALQIDATLEFRALKPRNTLELTVPRVQSTPGSWRVERVTVDGAETSLTGDPAKGARIALSAPLAAGDTVTVGVVYDDSWSMIDAVAHSGRATDPQGVLPRITDAVSTTSTLTVGVAAGSGLAAAQSGKTVKEWDTDDAHWVTSTTDGPPTWPVVAFGEWVTASAPSVEGLPSVRVNLFRDAASGIETFPPFLRTIVAYDQNLLPPFPNQELEVLQSRDDMARFVWTARPGLVTLQQMQVYGGEARTRSNQPHLEQEVLAHEVAHQWWGGLVRPARSEDRWMSETMATVYACVFVGALFDPKDCEVRKSTWRDTWEKELTAFDGSVRDAQATSQWVDVAYAYGPYVMLHMLRGRIGDEAFFGALDRYARDRVDAPATTDRLQAAFEATSGKDLHDFFAWWLVGGFVPALHLTLDGTSGTLTSDIPFGTFDVPVVVVTADGEQTLWVDVVDGTGTFTAPAGTRKVLLDPNGLVLARTRKVSRR